MPEQHRVRTEAKTEDSEELPPEKHQSKDSDAEPVAQWRAHTAGDEAQRVYRQRAAPANCVNALACHRGLQRLTLRALAMVRAGACLNALPSMSKFAPYRVGRGAGASAATLAPS